MFITNHRSIIVPEGLPFILLLGIIILLAFYFGFPVTACLFIAMAIFVAWFFRNPERKLPDGIGYIISPADGKIIRTDDVYISEPIEGKFKKISIFMNIFNVHVNRMPCSGTIKMIRYKKGRFISANLDKASSLNEQNAVLMETDSGKKILTIQIAGLIARRIVCWIKEGMYIGKGERFGLIRFGSRLDVYLPPDVNILVKVGDKVKAGETPIGDMS
jgi:phosphatidylserine decarboxylase